MGMGMRAVCVVTMAIVALATVSAGAEEKAAGKRVTCVGDSITFGAGTKNRATDAYPAQLQKLLGASWTVSNFGVSGSTLLKHGDKPYQKQKAFAAALASKPDVVIIMLGTNDTKPQNWKFKDEFVADYKDLVGQFKALESKPTIYVCYPVVVPGKGNFGINEEGVKAEMPLIDQIAKDENAKLIDMHAVLDGKPELLPDRVHPNTAGAGLMAKAACKALTGAD